ncbi:shikimate dehydrogenase family protein [Paraburkholderia largidicola]|uniref:Shikimate dehydrogenase n=1 Tax=Paraburkholderia largidicola TaxID=3014751 RepID=A0A7I8C416_9BURK|nr:shikimate dehydrogenase [Paraburkholderia sp. PGU16]BCF95078.1 shikimate dehydrogenase [Paraburkholderia sp. PGU16]
MSVNDHERRRLDAPVDAATRLFFIFGSPISHVRAPVIWSALMKRYGLNAVFLPAHVDSADFDEAIAGIKGLKNVDGMMFTMPHKIAALKHADVLTERAQLVGSINLLRRSASGIWEGDNVDGAGFVAGLKADNVLLDGINVYVHGCGGVGQNIAWSLAMEPIASLTVFDIDSVRAAELAGKIGKKSSAKVITGTLASRDCGLAINASPLGLKETDPVPFPVVEMLPSAIVADVIMEPMMTPLLTTAQARGLKVHHGRNMMNYAMPIAAAFYGLPSSLDWNGGPLQN